MKSKILALVSMACLILSENGFGQGDFGQVTPQTADFMKYGEIPVSLFTGKMNLDIPIYRIKDQDFDIPISLLYTSDGFKPDKRSDFVGLDWTLVAGGCITRETYGTADESWPSDGMGQEVGYLHATRQGYNKENIYNFALPEVVPDKNYNFPYYFIEDISGFSVDYQPDLFLFNFNGHRGQFMIDNQGNPKVNNKNYRVDISGLTTQYMHQLFPEHSVIKITDPNGYIYEFGGDLSALEFSISFKDNTNWNISPNSFPTILAWHLSKITTPNGRTVTFNYLDDPTLSNWSLASISPIWQSGRAKMVLIPGGMSYYAGVAIKKAILESIVTDGIKIEFIKSEETTLNGYARNRFFDHSSFNSPIYQLDNILVKYNNELRYTYVLDYYNQNKRRFLSSITLPYGKKYEFLYNHTNYPLPDNSSLISKIDAYGYWSANNEKNSYGLMSQVNYPTGGYSCFEYEKHQYSSAVELNITTLEKHKIPASNVTIITRPTEDNEMLYPEGGFDGDPPPRDIITTYVYTHNGTRIKEISHYSDTNIKEMAKKYFYTNTLIDKINASSGILYQSRPYFIQSTGSKNYITENTWNKNYNIDESAIGYSSIFEQNLDESYCHYEFVDYKDRPDISNTKIKFLNGSINDQNNLDRLTLITTSHNKVESRADQRGLLKEKSIYDATGGIQSIESEKSIYDATSRKKSIESYQYKYQDRLLANADNHTLDDDCIISFKSMTGGGLAKKIYLDTYHPISKKEVETDNVVQAETYGYNDYDLLQTKSFIINSTDMVKTNYTYPFEYLMNPYSEMVEKNIISPVVEKITVSKKGAVQKEIERVKTDYFKDGTRIKSLILPNKISSSYSAQDNLRTDIVYDLYNSFGRVLQYTGSDGIPVTLLWSYKNQHIIAKIENATYESVRAALNYNNDDQVENLAANNEPSSFEWTTINNLRTLLPKAMVTTYTYKPLVGLRSVKDPNEKTIYYEYDTFDRLKCIKDHDGKVVESYNYHYRNK